MPIVSPDHDRSGLTKLRFWVPALILGLASLSSAEPAETATSPGRQQSSFIEDVWPILSDNCLTCHGPYYQLSGLRLDSAERVVRGGKGGPVVEPHNPEASELFRRISRAEDDPDRMPQKAPRLDNQEIEVIRSWIESGADFGDFVDAETLP